MQKHRQCANVKKKKNNFPVLQDLLLRYSNLLFSYSLFEVFSKEIENERKNK